MSTANTFITNQPSNYKLRLIGPGGTIWSETSPTFAEHRTASFSEYSITHLPTDISSYSKTSARTWDITIKLVSRSVEEAAANADYLLLARRWVLPNFGRGVGAAGATPPILKLYAYANHNINGIPVILTNYNFSFPQDIDYIYGGSEPFPVIADLSINVKESWSPKQISEGKWQINRPMNPLSLFDDTVSRFDPVGRYQDSRGYSLDENIHNETSKYIVANMDLKEYKVKMTVDENSAALQDQQKTGLGRGARPDDAQVSSIVTEDEYDALGNKTGGTVQRTHVVLPKKNKPKIKDTNQTVAYQGVIAADTGMAM